MRGLQNRLRLLSLFVFLFALLLVGKLYLIQIVSGENFETKAEHQYVAGVNYFDRGLIYFTTKDSTLVPAASIKTGFILYINPNILGRRGDLEEIYEIVNAITALPMIIESSKPIMPLAVSIAMQSGITVYDAMYVAIARIYETQMITADKKLTDALAKTDFKKDVRWLGTGLG